LNAVTLLMIFYYSEIKHDIVLRIIAASITIAIIRACIARELFRQARGRTHMRLFAFAMSLFALLSCARGVVSYLNGAPENYMQTSSFQTIAMVGDLIYICVVGLFFFTMINNRMLELIRDQSEQDPLAGIFNRRAIDQRLSSELRRITRNAQKLSIALIDIDYFKAINDTSGHAAGDDALRAVVDSIAGQLRSYDMLGRYGGDEFLLILPQTRCTDAFIAVERIRQTVSSFSHKFYSPSLTLSIGLSEAIPGENAASLLSRADQALYEAKRAGRNCTRLHLQVHALEIKPALEPSSSPPASRINLI
jgi:diguanylate cyclase (GGDEF)-like protein